MIKFFRSIRQKGLSEGKTGKYLKYALGEIALVVIGILIALQINNWNEDRKADKLAKANYLNLLTSLQQDSIKVQQTIESNKIGLDALSKLIPLERNEELLALTAEALNQFLYELTLTSRSFMPNSGIYNLLTSNNGFDLIESEVIKSKLINLYDYQYKSYLDTDVQIDTKYHNELGSLIKEKIGWVAQYTPEVSIVQNASPELFEAHYFELASESRDIYSTVAFNRNSLIQIQEFINELLSLIRAEIKK